MTRDANGVEQSRVVYALGLQRIAQATFDAAHSNGAVLFFGQDARGSTRLLIDNAGAIATVAGLQQIYHFDAYGMAMGFNPSQAATSYLYSGEQFDSRIDMQYLRRAIARRGWLFGTIFA